ncbi:MAG: carboxypeptidase regulatory-like domain-containing protein, partial [Proteobacteria bacterium]|nr:carboxypeptidase regulatory-like domain-containing protein [Pseudomonadota bacterium]
MNRDPSFRMFSLIVLSVFFSAFAWAGETGKLSGVVRDSTTGEPLVGANIILLGTTLGSATDANGAYFVNNIPPGAYRVRISMVEYHTVVYENVRINVDITTELNVNLPSEIIELDREIVVTASRPVVQKDQTSTRTVVQGSVILNELRFQNVEDVLDLQAGVTRGTDGNLHIRGGRTGGTVYQVDGVPLLNPFTRSAAGEIEVQNVQELQAHLGTFDAEYGNAADGIVTVFTKDGTESYTGRVGYESARLNASPYQKKDWNLERSDIRSLSPDQQALYLDYVRKPDGSSAYDYVSVLDDPNVEEYLVVPVLGTFSA